MSVEVLNKVNMGNLRVHAISYVASAAEDNITTGLDYVDFFVASPKSVTTSFYTLKQNEDSSGTASNGGIGSSGLVAGDEFHIIAYGR
jgi:hypothetical protein